MILFFLYFFRCLHRSFPLFFYSLCFEVTPDLLCCHNQDQDHHKCQHSTEVMMLSTINGIKDSLFEMLDLVSQMFSLSVRVWSLAITILLQLLVIMAAAIFICWIILKLCVYTLPRGDPGYIHVAFFHPYCNAGGGGERVLWCAIRALQKKYKNIKCYVYTGDTDASPEEILRKAEDRFNVSLLQPVEFIFLRTRSIVEAKYYPFLTLLLQSIGSIFLAGEALSKFRPDIYIDSMGYAFTYPVFRFLGGCVVGCYTHYPTISTDMLKVVCDRVEAHNNRGFIAKNAVFSTAKVAYYRVFAELYSLVGWCAKVVMVNSSWTNEHITKIWGHSSHPHIVYPPCNTDKFKSLQVVPDSEKKMKTIVSIGQFRPEKDHALQLKAFQRLCEIVDPATAEVVQLVIIGGCRNEEDKGRVDSLKELSSALNIENKIVWKLNASFEELLHCVQQGTVGLHTMWCEHFGICVVECMAGGLIMVAHDSGGPKMDIVTDYDGEPTGYRASDVESYAQAMKTILEASDEVKENMRISARQSVDRFSDTEFEIAFLNACDNLFSHTSVVQN